eukprot:scaffold250_cov181-Chaetoceros_neogracile.AAC.1
MAPPPSGTPSQSHNLHTPAIDLCCRWSMGELEEKTIWGSHRFLIAVRREIPAAGTSLANRAKWVGSFL